MSIKNLFEHINLTEDQNSALDSIQDFLNSKDQVFILKGYAGSGKTTLLTGIVKYLSRAQRPFQLMAPTGRAAKVIHDKTKHEATTIHKGIYSFDDLLELEVTGSETEQNGSSTFLYQFELRQDKDNKDKVFLIDEASMVSNNLSQGEFFRFGSGYLMDDLFTYARIKDPELNTKIIFVGDPAQLPPVNMNFSPALSELYLKEKFNVEPGVVELKEVKRQGENNGILKSASNIRKSLTSGYFNDFDVSANGVDRFELEYSVLMKRYFEMPNPKQIISYTNKTSQEINKRIREIKYGADLDIQTGDLVINGSNNYKADILNGEFAVITEASENIVHRHIVFKRKGGEVVRVDLNWRYIKLMKDNKQVVEGYMLENYLTGDAYLHPDEMRALYVDFKKRNPRLKPKTAEFKEAIKHDLYFNAIMIKYGYSVTCHKAQGGEWDRTIVIWDKGTGNNSFEIGDRTSDRKNNRDFYQWAYTAVTRASKELYSLNPPRFNSYSAMNYIEPAVQESFKQLTGTSVSSEEVQIDDELQQMLSQFNLLNQPLQLQDHFIALWFNLRKKYVDIVAWERKNYEVWYKFQREEQTCGLKFWINGKFEFKSNYAQIPALTNSEQLLSEINNVIANLVPVKVLRNTADTIIDRIEFEAEIEEKHPFLKVLFDDISMYCDRENIGIDLIEHQQYKDRYTFSRGQEKAVVDFEYNKAGFFGRVLPLVAKSNSTSLLDQVKFIIKKLKEDGIQ